MKTVCLDFNGVLDQYKGWRGPDYMYPPRPGVKEFLKRLKDAGYKVMIHSTMDTAKIGQWMIDNGLWEFVDGVTPSKPPAVVYVDDRAVCFRGDYDATFAEIETFHAYWEKEVQDSEQAGK